MNRGYFVHINKGSSVDLNRGLAVDINRKSPAARSTQDPLLIWRKDP